ncbi:GCN5-related N-acetyltransferase 6, chloroplastic-like isoform X2 [Silene latifolia]|uniref:GCN5-related N-acetyltransferase 6, chloroplastic-like isoform X2 n=1 Tax=Silene latifolia TaxID=37657 RepID=UPI003D76AE4B
MSSNLAFSNAFIMLSGTNHKHLGRGSYLPCKMEMQSKSFPTANEDEYSPSGQQAVVKPHQEETTTLETSSELQFTKLQQINREIKEECRYFGDYVARKAQLDEEYWTAAWLRAESHWEDRPNDRYVESYKRQFAEQEFNALKRKSQGHNGQKSACIVAEKITSKLSNIKRKETSRYWYVSNLCVAKSARRKGIAVNMLTFAFESAKLNGVEMIFVHVHRKNTPAQLLYHKLGFEIVDEATSNLQQEQMYLLSIKTWN